MRHSVATYCVLTANFLYGLFTVCSSDFDYDSDKSETIKPYKFGSTHLFAPLKVDQPFCSFFDNRSPTKQQGLLNCTWYKDNSCCRQAELESIFKRVKPLQGASDQCLLQINYMICWVCDPTQHIFYLNGWRRLTMCGSFCNTVLNACKDAKLKGDLVGTLYPTGAEFCRSRRFEVATDNQACFSYTGSYHHKGDRSRVLAGSSAATIRYSCLTRYTSLFLIIHYIHFLFMPVYRNIYSSWKKFMVFLSGILMTVYVLYDVFTAQ